MLCKNNQSYWFFRKTKKAQIAETMTWIVATILIIIILIASAIVVSVGDKSRKINNQDRYDLLATKSFVGYLKTKQGQKNVYENIKNDLGLSDSELCSFSKNILKLYKEDYSDTLIIASDQGGAINSKCFEVGSASKVDFMGDITGKQIEIQLNEKNKINMYLSTK